MESPGQCLDDSTPTAPAEPREGFCAIYFSVDPLTGGNHFGVCCMDESNKPTQAASTIGIGEAPWWTICTRRNGHPVERRPSKIACWRAAAAGSDAELKATCPVSGANERMPLRRQDCVGV